MHPGPGGGIETTVSRPILACLLPPRSNERPFMSARCIQEIEEEIEMKGRGESFSRCIGSLHGMACTEYVGFHCA